jgi:hypothetical protein
MTNTWDTIPPEFGSYRALIWDVEDMNVPASSKKAIGTHRCDKEEDFPWINNE